MTSLRGGGQRGRWRFDALFGCYFQSAFESELDLTRGFLACVAMRHDAGPFDDLSNETFVAFLRRIPDADFVIAGTGLHRCFHHGCGQS
jgi:hypothetical protein